MSILGSEKLSNPVKKAIEWGGGKKHGGRFYYYDKEKKEDVLLPETFQVIALDELITVKGFDDEAETGIYSNEVRNNSDRLTVKNFKGDLLGEGSWKQELKGKCKGKYAKSIYAVMVGKNGVGDLVNISLYGSGISPWIEGKFKVSGAKVFTFGKNPEQKKKGSNRFYEPSIEEKELPDGDYKTAAIQIYTEVLQPYLDQYLNKVEDKEEAPREVKTGLEQPFNPISTSEAEESTDLPF